MLDSFIVEANVIFAALIKKSDNFKLIFLLHKMGIELYSPQFVFEEIKKREEKLLRLSKLDILELKLALNQLFRNIKTVPKSRYESFLTEAISGLLPVSSNNFFSSSIL